MSNESPLTIEEAKRIVREKHEGATIRSTRHFYWPQFTVIEFHNRWPYETDKLSNTCWTKKAAWLSAASRIKEGEGK